MANEKKNPLIGAFRAPVSDASPPPAPDPEKPTELSKATPDPKAAGAAVSAKSGEDKKPTEPPKQDATPKDAGDTAPAKSGRGKKSTEPPKQDAAPKDTGATAPAKPGEDKKATEPSKKEATPKDTGAAAPAKPGEDKKPTEPPKKDAAPKDAGATAPAIPVEDKKPDEPPRDPNLRFVSISEIQPLPGTYVKDTPREDYGDLIASIKKSGLEKPVILRQGEKGTLQLVDGFHRCRALEKAGMLEVRADVYEMSLTDASRYRKEHRNNPDLPIPGKLVLPRPAEPEKSTEPPKDTEAPAAPGGQADEIPKDFKLPITKEGQPEIITTLKVADIHPFEGHPFNVRDDKDMWDLVDSVKKFGILEPVVVIPRKEGGYEMISGHRRQRACQLAGIMTMPVIVRQLDRDESIISMVDANLKRENITPMEKARAYSMKLEAMKRKAGRRSKSEVLSGEKPMRADEQLAQQTGESRSNIQKITRLTKLEPELQKMVDDKKLPVHTAADISYLKKDEQKALADAIKKEDKVPSGTQAAELKKASQAGTLTTEKIEKTVAPTKREETPPLKITLNEEDLRPYFPDKRTTIPDVKRAVFEALDLRKKALERQKAKAQAGKDGKPKPPSPER